MSQEAVLKEALSLLERLGVDYMLTGSYASNIYGRPRSTFDADIVVALSGRQLDELLSGLGADFYVDAANLEEIRDAGGGFNAIHRPTGLKIDFYMPRGEHDRQALGRRRSFELWGAPIKVIAPEDLILAKLLWSKQGGSARQLEDARGVYQLQQAVLDMSYLRSKAGILSVSQLLDTLAGGASG